MDETERRASAEEDEFERELELGHHSELVPRLLSAIEEEPLRERRCRQLMLALYRCGRTIPALEAFQRLRDALRDGGYEPSDESYYLERGIVLHYTQLDWRDPNSVTID